MRPLFKKQIGFTLVEMVIVIVITGIIGGIVAMFIRAPVQGYADSARRAELTDIADTALRRMSRDVHSAVPNSIRTTATSIEFIPTKDGGRYRADTPGNILNFGAADGDFDVVGTAVNLAAGDYIAVGSTQSDGSLPYDETVTGVLRPYASQSVAAGVQKITFTNTALPVSAELPSQRFDVVDGTQQAVTYSCAGTLGTLDANNDGQGSLVRHWQYWSGTGAAHAAYSSGGSSAMLANKVSACSISYDAVNQRFGLLAVRLTLTSGGESVTLYNEIHVNNAP